MTDFMERGHFTAHLRQLRQLDAERRQALLDALQRSAGEQLQPVGSVETGMHLTVRLRERDGDRAVAERAARQGLDPRPLSALYLGPRGGQGLVLGFSGVESAGLRAAAATLASVL